MCMCVAIVALVYVASFGSSRRGFADHTLVCLLPWGQCTQSPGMLVPYNNLFFFSVFEAF